MSILLRFAALIILSLFAMLCRAQVNYSCGKYYSSFTSLQERGLWTNCNTGGDFTVAAWVAVYDDYYKNNGAILFHRQIHYQGPVDMLNLMIDRQGQFKFRLFLSGGWVIPDSLSSGVFIETGKWYHVAVTLTATGECKFYINGNLTASKTFAAGMNNGSGSRELGIGSNYTTALGSTYHTSLFRGFLDELAFCEKALTESEIRTLANGLEAGDPFLVTNKVVNYLKFNSDTKNINSGTGGQNLIITMPTFVLCEGYNEPPHTNAGADQNISIPIQKLFLDGTASVDIDGSISSYLWEKVSAPADDQSYFNAPNNAYTEVKDIQEGTYVFRLTVKDNQGAVATDLVQVVVKFIPNEPPLVYAGTNKIIMLPVNTVKLEGNARDDDGTITSIEWTKIEGPGSSNTPFGQGSTTVTITNLDKGTHVFRLTVRDDRDGMSTDEVTVRVLDKKMYDPSVIVPAQILNTGSYEVKKEMIDRLNELPVRTGAATDGEAKLLITVDSDKPLVFELAADKDGALSDISTQANMGVNSGLIEPVDGKIFLVYRAPDGIGATEGLTDTRGIRITGYSPDLPDQKFEIPVRLITPPVLLIHDTWGDETDWHKEKFIETLEANGIKGYAIDYRLISEANLSTNTRALTAKKLFDANLVPQNLIWYRLLTLFDDMKREGYAVVKADLVAHGVGGLRARAYYQLTPPGSVITAKPAIHKLITIGTPHLGTRIGPVLFWSRFSSLFTDVSDKVSDADLFGVIDFLTTHMPWLKVSKYLNRVEDGIAKVKRLDDIFQHLEGKMVGPVFRDLNPDMNKNEVLKEYQAADFKVHTITGDWLPGYQPSFDLWNEYILRLNQTKNLENFGAGLDESGNYLSAKDLISEFEGKRNDIFTTTESARGKLTDAGSLTTIYNVVHSDDFGSDPAVRTLLNANVALRVKDLLLSANPSHFASFLPAPAYRMATAVAGKQYRVAEDSSSLQSHFADSGYITIDTTIKNKVWQAGTDYVTLTLRVKNGAKINALYLLKQGFGPQTMSLAATSQILIPVPTSIPTGRWKMAVLGFADSGKTYSDTITLQVQNDRIDSLFAFPSTIVLDSLHPSAFINVMGRLREYGQERFIRIPDFFAGHYYPNSIFTLSANGEVRAKRTGTDTAALFLNNKLHFVTIKVNSVLTEAQKEADQIDFPPLNDMKINTPPAILVASSSSGQKVSFKLVSGNALLVKNMLILGDTGLVTIEASTPGNAYLNPAAVRQTMRVLRGDQVLKFDSIASFSRSIGKIPLHALSSVGLPVTYTIVEGPATVLGDTLYCTGAGRVTVTASQPGSRQFNPAEPLTQSFCINPSPALIAGDSITCPGIKTYKASTNYEPVQFTWSYSNANTIARAADSIRLEWTSPGTFLLRATPVSGACAGPVASKTITVFAVPFTPVIAYDSINRRCVGDSITLHSSATEGNQWYRNQTPVSGENTSSFLCREEGAYQVKVTSPEGCIAMSAPVHISFQPLPLKPVITYNGEDLSVLGNYASYQWYLNGMPIPSATASLFKPERAGTYEVAVADTFNCTNRSAAYVVSAVSFTAIAIGNSLLSYYPNPARSELYIDLKREPGASLFAEIYTMEGKPLLRKELTNDHNILPVAQLQPAVYLLLVHDGSNRKAFKIVILR